MRGMFFQKKNPMLLSILIGVIMIAVLIAIPTGYVEAFIYQGLERAV